MDVELDAPPDRRHGEIEAHRAPARGADHLCLVLDRHIPRRRSASARTTSGCDSLGADRRAMTSVRRNTPDPGRVGCPSRRSMASELVAGHRSLVQQLLDDRHVIELAEVGGEVEGEPRPRGDDDPVGTDVAVDRPDDRGLPEADAGSWVTWTPCWVEKCSAEERGIRRSPASMPAVGPVTKPPGWAADSTAQRCSSVTGAVRSRTRPWRHVARRRASTRRWRVAVAPTPCSRSLAAVITPWWSASQRVDRAGRSAIGPPRVHRKGGGCRCQCTVDKGCAISRVRGARLAPHHALDRRTILDWGVRWGGGSGIRRGRRCRRGTGRSRCPRGARGPSPSRPAPAAPRTGPCSGRGRTARP